MRRHSPNYSPEEAPLDSGLALRAGSPPGERRLAVTPFRASVWLPFIVADYACVWERACWSVPVVPGIPSVTGREGTGLPGIGL
jgi:hypothetical protein